MKIMICVAIVVLILINVAIFISLRNFCKKHGNEPVEKYYNNIIVKIITIIVIGSIIGALGIALQFV